MARSLRFLVWFFIFAVRAWGQVEDETFNGPHIDKLIGEGKYEEAFKFIQAGLEKNGILQTYSATFFAGAGKFYLETGRLKEAGEALKAADTLAARTGIGIAFAARELAEFHLLQADFSAAATWAARALRESSSRKAHSIVLAYCRCLEALARLRSGDLRRADKLILEALRSVPEGSDAEPFFASRVLFAGCVIQSHGANYREARELCRRGLGVIEKRKIESRDVSLAHLAMAESHFLSGDLALSREQAEKCIEVTTRMFQREHQDSVDALVLLARIDRKESKAADALAHARAALDMAVAVFGEDAGGTKGPKRVLEEMEKRIAGDLKTK